MAGSTVKLFIELGIAQGHQGCLLSEACLPACVSRFEPTKVCLRLAQYAGLLLLALKHALQSWNMIWNV